MMDKKAVSLASTSITTSNNATVFAALLASCCITTASAVESDFISSTSLNDLLNLEITVASGSENRLTTRESPGIVSVLTRKEIEAIGASDLYELLRHVAGYQVGISEVHLESFSVRGNYAGEGQILVLYDGVPVSEIGFGSAQYGGHFSVDHIERVEVIRGPGSALYGGSAELGVINVISKKMRGKTSAKVATNKVDDSTGYTTAEISTGFGSGEEGAFGVDFFAGISQRDKTEADYFSFDGTVINDPAHLEAESEYLQLNLYGGGFTFNLLYGKNDQNFVLSIYDLELDDGETFIVLDDEYGTVGYESVISQLQYRLALGERTSLTGTLFYGDYESSDYTDSFVDEYPEWYWHTPAERKEVKLALNTSPFGLEGPTFDIGLGYQDDSAEYSERHVQTIIDWYLAEDAESVLTPGTDDQSNLYLYAQGLFQFGSHTLTAGLRYDDHDEFGSVTVPRVALTYLDGPFHYKFLVSRAFKAPPVLSLGLSPSLEPEEASVIEVEVGYVLKAFI